MRDAVTPAPKVTYAHCQQGDVLATIDDGLKWTANATGARLAAGRRISRGQAGIRGRRWRRNSGYRGWRENLEEGLESLFSADPRHGWAVGWAGTILPTADGGTTWRQIRCDAASWSLSSVYFRNATEGWIAGFGGQLLHSGDGGGVKGWHTSVCMDAAGRVWVTADNRLLLPSEDNGKSWQVAVDNTIFVNRLVTAGESLMVLGPFGIMRQ